MSVGHWNWGRGLFRLWLSAAVLWWLAGLMAVVGVAGRETVGEYWRVQGIDCARVSATALLTQGHSCRSAQGDPEATDPALEVVWPLFMAHLEAPAGWIRWSLAATLPFVVLLLVILVRLWLTWLVRGFSGELSDLADPVSGADSDAPLVAPFPDIDEELRSLSISPAGSRRASALRTDIVRATQTLNALHNGLAELEWRMRADTKTVARDLRLEMPDWGRKLIKLAHGLDKNGLEPNTPLLFADPQAISSLPARSERGA